MFVNGLKVTLVFTIVTLFSAVIRAWTSTVKEYTKISKKKKTSIHTNMLLLPVTGAARDMTLSSITHISACGTHNHKSYFICWEPSNQGCRSRDLSEKSMIIVTQAVHCMCAFPLLLLHISLLLADICCWEGPHYCSATSTLLISGLQRLTSECIRSVVCASCMRLFLYL